MTFMESLRIRAGQSIISLLWLNVALLVARAWWGMDADTVVVIGGGAAVALTATLTWWRSPTGTGTRISTGLALAATVALLVYAFTGSPLQIDMHMYFFASLAICAIWVDWRPIVAFAALTAVHHLLLYVVLPHAAFPGTSDFGRVVLHAVILILEAGILVALGHLLARAFSQNDTAIAEARRANIHALEMSQRAEAASAESAAEDARRDAERRLDNEQLQFAIDSLGAGLESLARGDLRYRLDAAFTGSLDKLRTDFNSSMGTLEGVISGVGASSVNMRNGTEGLRLGADRLSQRTEQQAASLEETAAAIGRITETVQSSAERAREAGRLVANANRDAGISAGIVSNAVSAMTDIEGSSHQISQIISVIDGIAFQTNLLALNAGVEAARAGEAGRGFAVVAQEVRELAQRSANAAKEINGLIAKSSSQVSNGVALVNQTGDALRTIGEQINTINAHISAIVETTRDQASAVSEINSSVNEIDRMTQQNAAMAGDTTRSVASLADDAETLVAHLSVFSLSGSHGATAVAPRQPASRAA
ncbi:methyl-accepting chemotaxis protein [Hoeflea marina]|uniref:Methyl-accepting chemotaxis protein n=1 Tax=Hoeflea marina TaxID=274592 RepID=A0A317PDX0_9HYPH|nr:methyl-accepting chemotaxis protein [Hoeflea marina]PWV97590.1 methyl-accepting chemotaxis protein [Hoeflea marina]